MKKASTGYFNGKTIIKVTDLHNDLYFWVFEKFFTIKYFFQNQINMWNWKEKYPFGKNAFY